MTRPLVLDSAEAFRAHADAVRARGGTLGFVPTMGALHAGHLALTTLAAKHSTDVVVSIFVNPTQFGVGEDLARYPRPFAADLAACANAGVSAVFAPRVSDMYPAGEKTRVRVSELQDVLCGASRPNHFDGVATIVAKLFTLAGPCVAVFGQKDYQQLKIIERMTKDLLLPVRVIPHPIVRDVDGLALSSRNQYLSAEERERALAIPRAIEAAKRRFIAGEAGAAIASAAREELSRAGLRVDYAELVDPEDLGRVDGHAERALVAVAAFAGTTRLIDNALLGAEGGEP